MSAGWPQSLKHLTRVAAMTPRGEHMGVTVEEVALVSITCGVDFESNLAATRDGTAALMGVPCRLIDADWRNPT